MPKGIYLHKKGIPHPKMKGHISWLKGKKGWKSWRNITGLKLGGWNKGRKGIYHCSEETIKRMKIAKGNMSGKTKLKMSEGQKKRAKEGRHNFWKGGITPINAKIRSSIEFDLWRSAVFARDNWTCQKIGIKGGRLVSHHIQNFAQFPELRFALDNGITLSKEAHREFHKKYGYRNNTKEQIKEFLNKK